MIDSKKRERAYWRKVVGVAAGVVAAAFWSASPAAAVAEGEPEGAEAGAVEAESGEAAAAMETPTPMPQGTVPRASFTTAVVDREPTDRVEVLENDAQQILYFTELEGLEGQTVTHRWQHDGEVKAEVPFEVRGPRWRVYSSKNLDPSWLGEWTVAVVDEQGRVLRQDRFRYQAEAPEEASPTPAAPAAPALDVP